MFVEFERLNKTKQDCIINSAIHVFAQKGYKKAATDEITKLAGISKGSLFVYFQNKQNLFLYIYDFVLDTLVNNLLNKINTNERDVLERLNEFFIAELELVRKYPDMFEFVKMVNSEDIPALSEHISQQNMEKINRSYAKISENINRDKFQDDIQIDQALNIIRWTLTGLSENYRNKCKQDTLSQLDFGVVKEEVDSYFKLFKKLFYKTEENGFN